MGELLIRGFRPGDAQQLRLQPAQESEAQAVAGWRDILSCAHEGGPAWSGEIGGQVVGCAGFILRWQGMAEAWAYISPDIPRAAWLKVHRYVQARMHDAHEQLGVWRVQADVKSGFVAGMRWALLLGLQSEGVMRRYGPDGSDFVRYAKVWQ